MKEQFGAGAQEDSVSYENFHTLEQMQDLQKVQREHFKLLKSDLKRERSELVPFYLMHGRKQPVGFLEKKTCLVYPSALQALSGLQGKDGDVPEAKEARLGPF